MNSPPKPTKIKRAAHAETRIVQIADMIFNLPADPTREMCRSKAREIAALYDRALTEAEELIDNLFGELEDFPPPAAPRIVKRERPPFVYTDEGEPVQPAGDEVEAALKAERDGVIQEAIDALIYAYAGVLSVTADKVNFQIIPALAALLSSSGDRT